VFAKVLLGMIAATAIQRFVYKLVIALALTREMKTDSANIAFWNGKWYAMGWYSMSQPAREYLCKVTELGMFAGDFVLGHMLLFAMAPVIIIPHIDKAHSMMLFWLRPRYVLAFIPSFNHFPFRPPQANPLFPLLADKSVLPSMP
jgi:1,3-beta-glucan synthase